MDAATERIVCVGTVGGQLMRVCSSCTFVFLVYCGKSAYELHENGRTLFLVKVVCSSSHVSNQSMRRGDVDYCIIISVHGRPLASVLTG